MGGMSLLPQKFPGTQERPRLLLPAHHRTPLVVNLGQIPVGVNVIFVKITEKRLRGRAHAQSFLQRLQPSVSHPGNLRRKSLHMILFLFQQRLRDKHRKIHILHPRRLESVVKLPLYQLPDGIARRLDYHTSLYGSIVNQLSLLHHIRIPLSKIHIHGGDFLHHLF